MARHDVGHVLDQEFALPVVDNATLVAMSVMVMVTIQKSNVMNVTVTVHLRHALHAMLPGLLNQRILTATTVVGLVT